MLSGWWIIVIAVAIFGVFGTILSVMNGEDETAASVFAVALVVELVIACLFFVLRAVMFIIDRANGVENLLDWIEVVGLLLIFSSIFNTKITISSN